MPIAKRQIIEAGEPGAVGWDEVGALAARAKLGNRAMGEPDPERPRRGGHIDHRRGRVDAGLAVFEWGGQRSEEQTSELQSLMRISYAVFCLKKKKQEKI